MRISPLGVPDHLPIFGGTVFVEREGLAIISLVFPEDMKSLQKVNTHCNDYLIVGAGFAGSCFGRAIIKQSK